MKRWLCYAKSRESKVINYMILLNFAGRIEVPYLKQSFDNLDEVFSRIEQKLGTTKLAYAARFMSPVTDSDIKSEYYYRENVEIEFSESWNDTQTDHGGFLAFLSLASTIPSKIIQKPSYDPMKPTKADLKYKKRRNRLNKVSKKARKKNRKKR